MKLLLVEDDTRISQNLKKGLEQQNHIVDTAEDGLSGYDFAANESYDAIILDWMLPELSGPDVLKKIRDEGVHTPVLMLTARSASSDIVQGLDAGADDYLSKPFSFQELLARLRALSRRPENLQAQTLTTDNLELNPETNIVTRAGTIVDISKKEFMLLEYLLRNKGKTLSKEQLLENVWSFDDDVLPNTAQVYIGYLRKKIDDAFPKQRPLIETVRGFGYRIVDTSQSESPTKISTAQKIINTLTRK